MKPRKFDRPDGDRPRPDRPFNKFRSDAPRSAGERDRPPYRKPFNRDSRPSFEEDEQFEATGELADIVGTHPLDRREILRRMWRHYQDAGLVKSTGVTRPRPPREDRPDRPPRRFEDRPPRRFEGEREGALRRYERRPESGDRPFSRDREDGPKRYPRRSSDAPRSSSRRPAGKHPAARRADAISKIPHRKFKETRERSED